MALVLYGNLTEYTNYNTHTIHKEPCLTVFFVSPGASGKKESTSESDADGEKVRRHAAKFGYGLRAIYADLKKSEAEHIATGHSIYSCAIGI